MRTQSSQVRVTAEAVVEINTQITKNILIRIRRPKEGMVGKIVSDGVISAS
jgi:hypothetical protein